MLVLAVFTVIAGERLARREVEERIPVDRDRLLDLSATLETELDRLDYLYLGHLNHLVVGYASNKRDEVKVYAENIVAIKSMYLFSRTKKVRQIDILTAGRSVALPEVGVENQRAPLGINRAVIIPIQYFEPSKMNQSGWLKSPEGRHLVYWARTDENHLVAIVVDRKELQGSTAQFLKGYLDVPLAPLLETDTHFLIASPSGDTLIRGKLGNEQGTSALVVPLRTQFGEWHVQAWDGVSMKSHHDVFTLAVASALAVAFVISGILLYQQQRRSLKLARQRVSFVNQVSHELGSPLTNVTLNLDLAEEALGDRSPEAKHRLGLISQEVGRLNRLVANVLTFSQCDRGVLEIHKEPCFPDDVIAVILDSYRPALTRRGVEVEYVAGANARVDTDPDALSQIIANLVSNVEKYASSGQWLRVTTSLRNGQLIVSVMDHGPGIPQEARNRIFESFERVVTRVNEGSSGAGLGLSIARQLAIKLGGNLKLLDCDEGCHFELTIPSRVICSVIVENELVI